MIRVLAGSALAALAAGLAGWFVAPTLSGIPSGEPMLVAGSGSAALLQQVNFSEAVCAERLLLAEREQKEPASFVTIAVQVGPAGLALAVEELAADGSVPDGTLIFAIAPNGQVVGLWDAAAFRSRAGDALLAGCADAEPHKPVAGSI